MIDVELAEVLRQVVDAEPGLSTKGVYDSLLEDERAAFSSVTSVDRALGQLTGAVHRQNGLWYPGSGKSLAPAPPPTTPFIPISDPARVLDNTLRERLKGRRLIAEAGLDSRLFEELTAVVEAVLRTRDQGHLARAYPYVFLAFMVGQGVYGYRQGNYWGSMPVARIDNAAGPLFRSRCAEVGLEDFDHLVHEDNASRYVGPILAHGGVPKYCLPDFFSLVIREMRHAGSSAEELLARWRTKKTAFFNVDKPVGRFLLYGGDLAVDLLDRCIAAIKDIQLSNRMPSLEESGLPSYILVGLRNHVAEIRRTPPESTGPVDAIRPMLVLDPWSPFGPEVVLPPFRSESSTTWRLWSSRGIEDVATSSIEARNISLSPAKVWRLELIEHGAATREWSLEGFDSSPALFFNSRTGRALSSARSVRGDSVWCLAPAGATLSVLDADRTRADARLLEELPDLGGAWRGYVVSHLDLRGIVAIEISYAGVTVRSRVQPESARPQIEELPLATVTTLNGLSVYAAPPVLLLPLLDDMDPSNWRIRLAFGQEIHMLTADDSLRVELEPLRDRAVVPSAMLTARGPLGSDLRLQFAMAAGLHVSTPDRLLFPGDRHAPVTAFSDRVSVNGEGPGQAVPLEAASNSDSVRAELVAVDGAASIMVRIPRLLWAAVDTTRSALKYTNKPIVVPADAVLSGEVASLAIKTGERDLPLQLHLYIQQRLMQSSNKVRTGCGDGRWAFDLAPFRGTIEQSEGDKAEFELLVGQRPVTVLRLRASIGVERVSCSSRVLENVATVNVSFVATTRASSRVARLWPVNRPWAPVEQEPVPDGAETVDVVRSSDRLPAGVYLLEIDVDDGWTAPVRPRTGRPNTAVVRVGEAGDRDARYELLRTGNAMAIVERALCTGHIARRLDRDELREIAPALMRALHMSLLDTDPGLPAPRGLDAAIALLCADPAALAHGINQFAAEWTLDVRSSARLGLAVVGHTSLAASGTVSDAEVRMLWTTAPAVAAGLDLTPEPEPEQDSRLREALNWSPDEGPKSLFTGEPVDQRVAGRPAEQLRALQSAIDLVPKAVLDQDTLVVANFEWLIAARSGTFDVERFYVSWRRRTYEHPKLSDVMNAHLAKRRSPPGTASWASFPSLTLAAAIAVTSAGGPDARTAHDLLWEATDFAPRLVQRDLVLANALHATARRRAEQ